HHSQKTIVDNEDELRISLELQITYDLIMEILSHGSRVQIISPEGLKKEVMTNWETSISLHKSS
ncbi:MAG: superfamily protein, partial [Daejeonella sp.]|nr:superfamily protein [Daejeonella sp.]